MHISYLFYRMNQNIDEYIKKSLNGDKDAFAVLFDEYRGSVKQMLTSLIGCDFSANDMLQETFIKAFLNLDKYNSNYSFKGWLLSIAKNIFIDSVRRRSAKSYKSMLSCDDVHDIIDDNIDIIEADVREVIALHIENLAPKYRKIVQLRYYVGLDYAAISHEMNIPEGSVKSLLYRAKGKLKKEIINYIDNEVSR